ncbi:MAG: diaminopimelate epimerase [Clostridiales Family XIII bacterium]|jgi:diaminopimelate epimerase|nr:diaminopimelate epimerase [Clostridiales Family XIII bacterium]
MQTIAFSKYHGCGNDFVIVGERAAETSGVSRARLAAQICDRHTGVGADGLIVVKEDPLEMEIRNSDGSSAPMCGNGIRCFALYCRDEGLVPPERETYAVRTLAGEMRVRILRGDPFEVEIGMGKPDFSPARSGVADAGEDFLRRRVTAAGRIAEVSSVFMGTVHTVVWTDVNGFDLAKRDETVRFARALSELPLYREKTNVNMARVLNEGAVEVMTWERGAGLTAACGTGACAVAVVGALEGRLKRDVKVVLPYGSLHVRIGESGEVFLSGTAVAVAKGMYRMAPV